MIQLTGSVEALGFEVSELLSRSSPHAQLVGRTVRFEVIHNGSSYQAIRIAIIPWWLSAPRDWIAIAIAPVVIWGVVVFGAAEVRWSERTLYLAVINLLSAFFLRYLSRQWRDRRTRPAHYALWALILGGGAAGAFLSLLFDADRYFSAKFRIALILVGVIQVGWIAALYNPTLAARFNLNYLRQKAFISSVTIK